MSAPQIEEIVDPDGKYFRIVVVMPKSALYALDNWQNSVWDECVRRAHEKMLMPVGSVLVGDPEDIAPDTGQVQRSMPEGIEFKLQEGSRIDMAAFREGFLGSPVEVSVDMVRVEAEVALGSVTRGEEFLG